MIFPRKLIVGLGNPGPKFRGTRHNVGAQVVRSLSESLGHSLSEKTCSSLVSRAVHEGLEYVLAFPQTYMNRSGEAVRHLVHRFDIDEKSDLLVILDDLDLVLGQIRLREQGSSGGHKGLESIIETLGTQRFSRLRIGIGQPEDPELSAEDYVLRKFTLKEGDKLEGAIDRSLKTVMCWAREGPQKAMSQYNKIDL